MRQFKTLNLHLGISVFIFLTCYCNDRNIERLEKVSEFYPSGEKLMVSTLDESGRKKNIYFLKNGIIKAEITYDDKNQEHFTMKRFFTNRILYSRINIHNGYPHGLSTLFYMSGDIAARIRFNHGDFSGISVWYFKSGNISQTITHREPYNSINGFYETGEDFFHALVDDEGNYKSITFYFKDGKEIEGKFELYSEENNIIFTGWFKKGKPEGILKSYFDSGNLESNYIYRSGLPHGTCITFEEDGISRLEIPYRGGNIHGIVKYFNFLYEGHVVERQFRDGKEIVRENREQISSIFEK